jgi:SAM-dependent methyltransferase
MKLNCLLSRAVLLLLPIFLLAQSPATDDEIWADFSKWVESVPVRRNAAEAGGLVRAEYRKKSIAQGLSAEEADRRWRSITRSVQKPELARVFWDAVFKFATGPNDPLKLLVETVREKKPGTALDVGMGGGRNALYLSSIGWDVTGYDYSPEAVDAAKQNAKKQGLRFNAIQSDHQSFDFGTEKWDLIVLSYITPWNGLGSEERVWRSLKPGGLIVYQYGVPDEPSSVALLDPWKRYRVVRFQDEDGTHDGWGGGGTRVMRLVAQKKP